MSKMKSRLWILPLSSLAVSGGCAVVPNGDFCDVARPIYISSTAVVDWLAENDEQLLRDVVSHNEKTETCP